MRIVLPVIMGQESLLSAELLQLGASPAAIQQEAAQVNLAVPLHEADLTACLAQLNLYLSVAERVLLEVAQEEVTTFDQFIAWVEALPWEQWIPPEHVVEVDGYTVESQLHATPSLQRLLKRGVVERLLRTRYQGKTNTLPERPEAGKVLLRFAIRHNHCSLRVDCTGLTLHKRGYRLEGRLAPLRETLASGLLSIMQWPDRSLHPVLPPLGTLGEPSRRLKKVSQGRTFSDVLYDPFCGSGTLVIEAARRAIGLPAALKRDFAMQEWAYLSQESLAQEREKAEAWAQEQRSQAEVPALFGSDIDPEAIASAQRNAQRAGVEDFCRFACYDAFKLSLPYLERMAGESKLLLLSNIPYGERIGDSKLAEDAAQKLGRLALTSEGQLHSDFRLGILSAHETTEADVGRKADKRRKLYNGRINCHFYAYYRHTEAPKTMDSSSSKQKRKGGISR